MNMFFICIPSDVYLSFINDLNPDQRDLIEDCDHSDASFMGTRVHLIVATLPNGSLDVLNSIQFPEQSLIKMV